MHSWHKVTDIWNFRRNFMTKRTLIPDAAVIWACKFHLRPRSWLGFSAGSSSDNCMFCDVLRRPAVPGVEALPAVPAPPGQLVLAKLPEGAWSCTWAAAAWEASLCLQSQYLCFLSAGLHQLCWSVGGVHMQAFHGKCSGGGTAKRIAVFHVCESKWVQGWPFAKVNCSFNFLKAAFLRINYGDTLVCRL